MPTILLPGYNGFVGRHCAELLNKSGYDVIGVTNRAPLEHIPFISKEIVCDLSDPDEVSNLNFEELYGVINLAGIATNTVTDVDLVKKINVGVHVNLYKHIAKLGLNPRIIAVSSGAVYDPKQIMPETEDSQLKNTATARAYEISKLALEEELSKINNLEILIARPFNHIGPGQEEGFIVPDLTKEISLALKEDRGTVPVGNLQSKRDYTDVRDVVRAYLKLLQLPDPKYKVYNICSGIAHSGIEIFDSISRELDAAGKVVPQVSSDKMRGLTDNSEVYGSFKRLHDETDWQPTIDFSSTIADYVDWFNSKSL